MTIINIWNNLVNSGTRNNSRDRKNKKIRVANIALIISALALNSFSLLNLYLGFPELILLDFIISLVALFCVYLNKKRKFKLSNFITFGLLPGMFFIYPFFVGNIGAEYYYFFFLVVGFYILDKKRTIYIYSIYIFMLFIGSKYAIYHNSFDVKYIILETVHYYPSIVASIIMTVIATYVFKNDTIIYEKAIESKNTELEQIKEQINKQNELLEERNLALASLHNDLTASLDYASQIQKSILLPEFDISEHFQSFFILNKPKDIVSGDFYWFKDLGDKQLIAVVDCTGHGVPGALMTAMGNTLLNEIVVNSKIVKPGKILDELTNKLSQTLNLGLKEDQVSDGMDMALCSIDKKKNTIEFAGAKRPLYHFSGNQFIEYKSTRASIDGTQSIATQFKTTKIDFKKHDRFYMFSDGYPDQFGGKTEKKEKLLIRIFKEILQNFQDKSMSIHKELLETKLVEWQNKEVQTDDIIIIGFEV